MSDLNDMVAQLTSIDAPTTSTGSVEPPPYSSKPCKQCGKCCGLIPVSQKEIDDIDEYIKCRVVPNNNSGEMCPFLSPESGGARSCLIYHVRPGICRAFPHSKIMKCPNGACGKLPEHEVAAIAKSGGEAFTTLNEQYGGLKFGAGYSIFQEFKKAFGGAL